MTLVFDLLIGAFVLLSLLMIVFVPVAYASPDNQATTTGIWIGSILWILLLAGTASLSFIVA